MTLLSRKRVERLHIELGEMKVRAGKEMGPGKQKKAAFMCANKQEEGRPSLKLHGQDVPEFKYLGLTIQGN